jgi:hypothetical protein
VLLTSGSHGKEILAKNWPKSSVTLALQKTSHL